MRKLQLVGILLIATSLLWFFWLSHRWTDRITPGWSWEGYYIGFNTTPDPETGEFPSEDTLNTYTYRTEIVPDSWRRRSVVLRDYEQTRDLDTGEATWEYASEAAVDPRTGQYLSGELQGAYYVFPRRLEKKTYRLGYTSSKALLYEFELETVVEGVTTYVFAYRGSVDTTESYVGTADVPGVDVRPGQAIRCADDQFVSRSWVEPVTGEDIKTEDSCLSGEALYDLRTGERLSWVSRWRAATDNDELARLAERARVARRDYLWASRYTPGLLLLGGLVTLAAGAIGGRKRRGT